MGNIGDWNPETEEIEWSVVTLRKDVPERFKPIVVIHELVAIDTLSPKVAHEYDEKFAQKWLSNKEFKHYIGWKKLFDNLS